MFVDHQPCANNRDCFYLREGRGAENQRSRRTRQARQGGSVIGEQFMSRPSVRVASLATSALSASALAAVAIGVVFASSARAADPTAATASTGDATKVGEVIVTGTRIPKPNLD